MKKRKKDNNKEIYLSTSAKVHIISDCPCCGSLLDRIKDQLFCKNKSCEAQNSKRVENFCKKSKIKGFGEKTVEKLGLSSIPELYELTEAELISIMGETMGAKLYAELVKSKRMTIATFISALSVPLIGKSAGDKLATLISSIEEITPLICKEAGLGEKATASLMNWIAGEYPVYKSIDFNFSATKQTVTLDSIKLTGLTVCCTGKIEGHTRSSIQEFLNSAGVKVGSSVTAKTDYLVCEEYKGSSKEKKAESLGIEIVSLTELINRIK